MENLSGEFTPMSNPLNEAYIAELLEEGIMPAGVVSVIDVETDQIYAVRNHNGRISGLPVIDLAQATGKTQAGVENYVRFRMKKRFGFVLPSKVIKLVPVESATSAYIEDIGNDAYPDIHHRMYFPFVARTDVRPSTEQLKAFTRKAIIDDVGAPQGGDVLFQLLDIHREILFDYAINHIPVAN